MKQLMFLCFNVLLTISFNKGLGNDGTKRTCMFLVSIFKSSSEHKLTSCFSETKQVMRQQKVLPMLELVNFSAKVEAALKRQSNFCFDGKDNNLVSRVERGHCIFKQ